MSAVLLALANKLFARWSWRLSTSSGTAAPSAGNWNAAAPPSSMTAP